MVNEVLDNLAPNGGLIVDATLGTGGHSAAILSTDPKCTVVGIDRDTETIDTARKRLKPWENRVQLFSSDYRRLPELALEHSWQPIRGIFADLGISSTQLDSAERGFSFRRSGPLDTAADLVNNLDVDDLASLLRRYSDERYARRIARAIVRERQKNKLRSTDQLADIVRASIPRAPEHIHPATRTFQALRIAVNDELDGLYDFIVGAARILAPGGRLVILSFHSLEDRLAKQAFRYLESDCVCPPRLPQCACTKFTEVEILTKRPLKPKNNEVEANPRSRSANLRALVRL
jgi:16S rRNA (cytosine1402-N4)-methyltransferase